MQSEAEVVDQAGLCEGDVSPVASNAWRKWRKQTRHQATCQRSREQGIGMEVAQKWEWWRPRSEVHWLWPLKREKMKYLRYIMWLIEHSTLPSESPISPFYSILFYPIQFYTTLQYLISSYSIPSHFISFHSIPFQSVSFHLIPLHPHIKAYLFP